MFEKMELIEERYGELERLLSDPEVLGRMDLWQQYSRELAGLAPGVELYRTYRKLNKELADARELLRDEREGELANFLQEEIEIISEHLDGITGKLKEQLLKRDPHDEKSVFLEIRAGTGGEEAALFAADLLRMYSRHAEQKGWKVELIDAHATDIGGYKEVIAAIEGQGVYSRLKYESGVHRVQRIPSTESGGRIHTSAATVAVLPEAQDVDVEINPNDLRIDVFRSSGHGGQSVNTTDSAVRVTHLPTGLVVSCQDEKSQLKNKEKALKVLKARLLDMEIARQNEEIAQSRKNQVGSGDRSERIRTYNYPQGRVTDHRIGLTLYQLENFLDGDLEEMIDALITSDQAEKLKNTEE